MLEALDLFLRTDFRSWKSRCKTRVTTKSKSILKESTR